MAGFHGHNTCSSAIFGSSSDSCSLLSNWPKLGKPIWNLHIKMNLQIYQKICASSCKRWPSKAKQFYGKKAWDKLGLEYVAYFSADGHHGHLFNLFDNWLYNNHATSRKWGQTKKKTRRWTEREIDNMCCSYGSQLMWNIIFKKSTDGP